MRKIKKILKIILILVFYLVFSPGFGYAQKEEISEKEIDRNQSGLKITPAMVEVVIDKARKENEVEIFLENLTNENLQLQFFPVNFSQKDFQPSIELIPADESYSYSLASYMKLESNSLVLKPKEKRSYKVTIADRQDLSPGGHYGALVARVVNQLVDDNQTRTKLTPSLASLILVKKMSGARFNLSLKRANWPNSIVSLRYPIQIKLLFQNEGNIHLIPRGRVEVKDMLNRLTHKGVINRESTIIFPESRKYFPVQLSKVRWSLPFSINKINVSGQDSINKVSYDYNDTYLYINPLFSAVVLAGIGYGGWKWLKK